MTKLTMPRNLLFIIIVCISMPVWAQNKSGAGMPWVSLEEAEKLALKSPRPILIDLYTDWCGWCKVMDKKTYHHEKVISYLQDKFYVVKIDAEAREPFRWSGREFTFNSQYQVNSLALYLTGGQLSYPTTVIIPALGEDPQPIAGFLKPGELEPIVKFFGEGAYKQQSFPDFQKKLRVSW